MASAPVYVKLERKSKLTLETVQPTPQVGQYWVHTDPLSLCQVKSIEGDGVSSLYCVYMDYWTPDDWERDVCVVMPLGPLWVYLHYCILVEPILDTKSMRIGDVYLQPESETFVFAAKTPEGEWAFYSDMQMNFGLGDYELFQRGPAPKGLTMWDHLV